MRVLLIDHMDSFVYNLHQQLEALGAAVVTLRSDRAVREAERVSADALVLSPGPGHPSDPSITGLSRRLLTGTWSRRPVLGVCLGHQLMGEELGALVRRAGRPVHGETSHVRHNGQGIFRGVPNPFAAARYHSLVVAVPPTAGRIEVTARTPAGVVMGLAARDRPWFGVQFHPESYLTPDGTRIVANFLALAGE